MGRSNKGTHRCINYITKVSAVAAASGQSKFSHLGKPADDKVQEGSEQRPGQVEQERQEKGNTGGKQLNSNPPE